MGFSIEHVAVRCRDMDASIEFYCRMFDAEIMFRRKMEGGKEITYISIGDTMLELMLMDPASEPVDALEHYGVHHIGIKVDDFKTVYAELKEKGAVFLGEPFSPNKGFQLVFLQDPNGAVIEIACRDPEIMQESIRKGVVNW